MNFATFNSDGDYDLINADMILRKHPSTTVVISKNDDVATIAFGYADQNDDFIVFPSGVIVAGALINHGYGCRLMVRISGIIINPVTIGYTV